MKVNLRGALRNPALTAFIILLSLFAAVGCRRGDVAPGNWTKGINFTNLVTEAKSLEVKGRESGQWYWKGNARDIPPTIRALSPQKVVLRTNPPPTLIDVGVKSGFWHRGVLIICDDTATNFMPVAEGNLRLRKIAPFVFEYRE